MREKDGLRRGRGGGYLKKTQLNRHIALAIMVTLQVGFRFFNFFFIILLWTHEMVLRIGIRGLGWFLQVIHHNWLSCKYWLTDAQDMGTHTLL